MTITIYTRTESGEVSAKRTKRYANEASYLLLYGLTAIEPTTERMAGEPHSYVKWFAKPADSTHPALERWPANCAAIGIGG